MNPLENPLFCLALLGIALIAFLLWAFGEKLFTVRKSGSKNKKLFPIDSYSCDLDLDDETEYLTSSEKNTSRLQESIKQLEANAVVIANEIEMVRTVIDLDIEGGSTLNELLDEEDIQSIINKVKDSGLPLTSKNIKALLDKEIAEAEFRHFVSSRASFYGGLTGL